MTTPKTNTPVINADKVGWRVKEWAADIGLSRAGVYLLLDRGEIRSVRQGKARIILTPPAEFLATLPKA